MALVLSLIVTLVVSVPPARCGELRLRTANDLLVTDDDDLYTFAVAFELQHDGFAFTYLENAFTDRAAELRFDESHLTVGRRLAVPGEWIVDAEVGVVHVGEGLFGEAAQNAVHALVRDKRVELDYIGSSLHGRGALSVERTFVLGGGRLDVGPRLEIDLIPGLRSHAVIGAQGGWRWRRGVLEVHALLGTRFSAASMPALEAHLVPFSAVARIGLRLGGRIALEWSYNDYGDGREHLSVGYRLAAPKLPFGGRR